MKFKLLILFIAVLQFTGCQKNQKSETTNPKSDSKKISRNGYSITYDSGFRLDESGSNGTEFYLFSQKVKPGDDFVENINLIIQDLGTLKYDLNQFVTLSENQIKTNGKLIESARKKSSEKEYHLLIFEGKFNGLDLKFLQYDFVKNDKAYILTFSAKKNEFADNQKKMELIMNTFELK
jgi:hypothetical protein